MSLVWKFNNRQREEKENLDDSQTNLLRELN